MIIVEHATLNLLRIESGRLNCQTRIMGSAVLIQGKRQTLVLGNDACQQKDGVHHVKITPPFLTFLYKLGILIRRMQCVICTRLSLQLLQTSP